MYLLVFVLCLEKFWNVLYESLSKGTYTVKQMTRQALMSITGCFLIIYLFDIYLFYSNRWKAKDWFINFETSLTSMNQELQDLFTAIDFKLLTQVFVTKSQE